MSDNIAIKVDNLSKTFKLPHEKQNSVKGIITSFGKRKKTFEIQQALKDVSFEIKEGEFFGIVGRNGSGKSTLLKLLAGIYTPTAGSVQVNGTLTPFIELGVGFSPELTGRENVFLNGALLGFNRTEMARMYKDIVAFAELEKFMDQKLKNYSSGMQVRLAFSIAIRAKSKILLLDEVLAVGDEAFQKKCTEYFREMKNKRQTVILVTHDMGSVTEYCDRAMLVSDGEIKLLSDPLTIADAYSEINQLSGGKVVDLLAAKDSVQNGANIESVVTRSPGSKTSKSHFKFNEYIEIVAQYKLSEDIKNPTIDLGIKIGKSGTYYFYTTTEEHEMYFNAKKGATIEVVCRVKNIFHEGAYYVATSLYDSKSKKVYAREREAVKFETGKLPTGGIVSPEHQLMLKERPKK